MQIRDVINSKSREEWIDISKRMGIVTVILGHVGILVNYI
jgi:fucose 4-O-acetylase-like acetyltransferase